jgi:hypothetical protein
MADAGILSHPVPGNKREELVRCPIFFIQIELIKKECVKNVLFVYPVKIYIWLINSSIPKPLLL